jgi:hypothetical protein
MNRLKTTITLCLVFLSIPFAAVAMDSHEHGMQGHDKAAETDHHKDMKNSDQAHGMQSKHEKMDSDGSMLIVGSMTSKGVKGMAHLKDVSKTMADMGMPTTHHFMIAFVDEETGAQIESGTVALKITNPDAKVSEAIELVGMDGHFGADVTLDMTGEYHFRLGTQLADGKKRKYHFHQVIE